MTVVAEDIAQINTFFGDRPLDNPGYSAFALKDRVGIGQINDVLDVYRVEQRLAYLGFPAMGYQRDGVADHNVPQNFVVDGQWGQREGLAGNLFNKVTHYVGSGSAAKIANVGHGQSSAANSNPFNASNYNSGLAAAANSYFVSVDSPTNTTQDIDWLNAYNAPHWMQLFPSTPTINDPTRYAANSGALPGWTSTQDGTDHERVELFGTSWMRDLMVAKQFAPSGWVQPNSRFAGATDANHGYTPTIHASHDLGMAMDLSLAHYTSSMYNLTDNVPSQQVQAVQMVNPGHWSNLAAGQFLQALQTNVANRRQDLALADFFSLYAVTQQGADGSRDALATHINGSTDTSKVLNALFGGGIQAGGLINGVIIGGTSGSHYTYPSMRYALSQLGFRGPGFSNGQFVGSAYPAAGTMPSLANVGPHYHHFHIYLQPPAPVGIEKVALLQVADMSGYRISVTANTAQERAAATAKTLTPAIVRQIESKFNLDRRLIGTNCIDYALPHIYKNVGSVVPAIGIQQQLKYVHNIEITTPIKTRVTQPPKHGVMKVVDNRYPLDDLPPDAPGQMYSEAFQYVADPAYFKLHEAYKDWVSFEIDVNGYTFHFRYIIDVGGDCKSHDVYDGHGQRQDDAEPTVHLTLESVTSSLQEYVTNNAAALDRAPLQDWAFDYSDIPALLAALGLPNLAQIAFTNLTGAAVGSTTSQSITLDWNAAGHGWFIDPTPGLNEEFLPTADANVWKAKLGSAAEGRMDLLSVLLHEYGHALGLDHSAEGHDYMAATLQPGVRRLPTADEMAQLVALASGAKPSTPDTPIPPSLPLGGGLSALLLGRLRGSRFGSWSPVFDSLQLGAQPQYTVVANPTLTNPEFAGSHGWSTKGTVGFGNRAAVLTESAVAQTRLNQVFVLGDKDRFLRFTLADIALDDVNGAPDDAFEVALTDANTGLSLLGGTGLSRSDAFLNLQADGGERLAPQVTRTLNPDGSRTYVVDLWSTAGQIGNDTASVLGRKKKPYQPQSWLDEFLGVKDAQAGDLAQATGLTVRLEAGEGEKS